MLLLPYQSTWADDFRSIREVLRKHSRIEGLRVEHIGSTSIPGLAAKPIIDIDLVFEESSDFPTICEDLESIGYSYHGNQGIPGREVFKRKKDIAQHPVLDGIQHHLYVCHISSEELQRHLNFRDHLREDEASRIAYEQLKYEIARLTNQDRKAYAKLKETMAREFVESILRRSND